MLANDMMMWMTNCAGGFIFFGMVGSSLVADGWLRMVFGSLIVIGLTAYALTFLRKLTHTTKNLKGDYSFSLVFFTAQIIILGTMGVIGGAVLTTMGDMDIMRESAAILGLIGVFMVSYSTFTALDLFERHSERIEKLSMIWCEGCEK